MRGLINVILATVLGSIGLSPSAGAGIPAHNRQVAEPLRCVAFSPYVDGFDPERGPPPPPDLINILLEVVVTQAGFRCIRTYETHNRFGNDHVDRIYEVASLLGMDVIMTIWLTPGSTPEEQFYNDESVRRGIQLAKAYPNIIRISCGSEMRTRHGRGIDPIIIDCIDRVQSTGVTQPITTIETWWEWCDGWPYPPCRGWNMADHVDWIGINVFPWWENKFSGIYTCTPAEEAATFHIDRFQEIIERFPEKEVILTEFGWPAGPNGYRETNQHTDEQCGEASQENQLMVIEGTFRLLDERGFSGVLFEAFREPWKIREGVVGPFWGICEEIAPDAYSCHYSRGTSLEADPLTCLNARGRCGSASSTSRRSLKRSFST